MKMDPEREETLNHIMKATDTAFRAPGMLQWIEMLAEKVGEKPEVHHIWHLRICSLITEAAAEFGIVVASEMEANTIAGMLISEGPDDDGDGHECEPALTRDGERVVA